MGECENENAFTAVFRLTTVEYAEEFIKYGRIKFNTPQNWINEYKEKGPGRGDIYEGTLAFCNIYDVKTISELYKKYCYDNFLVVNQRPITTEMIGNKLLYKDQRSLKLPCFCMY